MTPKRALGDADSTVDNQLGQSGYTFFSFKLAIMI
jgi:hypothetical protein